MMLRARGYEVKDDKDPIDLLISQDDRNRKDPSNQLYPSFLDSVLCIQPHQIEKKNSCKKNEQPKSWRKYMEQL